MMMLANCSSCQTPLQLPPNAVTIRCFLCRSITHVASPSAVRLPPSPSPPRVHGNKRALIVGVSYRRSRHELKGSTNDAKCMNYFLLNRFHFPQESILTLTGCQPGDSLVFHYSGHGSQQRNYNGDEVDGFDETICPLDFETQGMILDDEINATIVRPLPYGVKLHAIIDACHSGTVLDLPFLCRMGRTGHYVWEDHRPRSGAWKGTNGGEAISFSGCDDSQTSADTSALSRITSTGAMTYCFLQAFERGNGSTYGSILNSMRSTIRNTAGSAGPVSTLMSMLVPGGNFGGLRQEPQLTSNDPFDPYKKAFSL